MVRIKIILILMLASTIHSLSFDGQFVEGCGVSLYLTPEGKLRTIGNDWDLNDDGWLDLVVINEFEWDDGQQVHDTYSYVFWGGTEGFQRTKCDSFPTHGAECAALADFDRDGWTDIVVANSTYDYSYVIYGSSGGYTHARRDSFKARANHGSVSVADLNRDGWLDLVWSNWYGWGGGYSRIYWGSDEGFDLVRTDSLPTGTAHGNLVADFDGDGFADIFWAAYYFWEDASNLPSCIYWGYEEGFSEDNKTLLHTVGPGDDISVGDFNKDGLLDIVIPNHSSKPPPEWTYYDYSYVYYGQSNRMFRMDSLYAPGPWSSSTADVDGDGWLDVILACSVNNYPLMYKGSPLGFIECDTLPSWKPTCIQIADFDNDGDQDIAMGSQSSSYMNILYQNDEGWDKHTLTVKGMDAGITLDLGNPATHKDEAWYISSIITATESADSLAVLEGYSIDVQTTWQGLGSPQGVEVELWASATPDPKGENWSEWIKLDPQGPYSVSGRAFRYKLCFKTGMRTCLAVNRVELYFTVDEIPEEPKVEQHGGRFFDIWLGRSTLPNITRPPTIYDRAGRKVRTLNPDAFGHVYWFGEDDAGTPLPAGVYFLLIHQEEQSSSHKLVLLAE